MQDLCTVRPATGTHLERSLVVLNQARCENRLPEPEWRAALQRVRGEFDEMPCTRVTPEEARVLFGLPDAPASQALLDRLTEEGFLSRTDQGAYIRRNSAA